jgi:hypothetical protein
MNNHETLRERQFSDDAYELCERLRIDRRHIPEASAFLRKFAEDVTAQLLSKAIKIVVDDVESPATARRARESEEKYGY